MAVSGEPTPGRTLVCAPQVSVPPAARAAQEGARVEGAET